MKLNYYADTDSLYIDLSEQPSVESRESSEGVVVDHDANGNLVGIDIDNSNTKVQLQQCDPEQAPVRGTRRCRLILLCQTKLLLLCQTKILASDHVGKYNVMC